MTLGSALGIDGTPDLTAIQRQSQEITAECMINAGWEYIPVHYPDLKAFTSVSDEDSVARITRQGLVYAWAALYSGVSDPETVDPWADFVDPNEAYLATLSEEEVSAYDVSLSGTKEEQRSTEVSTTRFDPETGSEWSTTTSGSGCQGEASAAVFAADSPAQSTEEVVVALTDHECTASLKDESAAIYADVEEEYTLAHEDELTALAASLSGGE